MSKRENRKEKIHGLIERGISFFLYACFSPQGNLDMHGEKITTHASIKQATDYFLTVFYFTLISNYEVPI